MWDLPNLAVGYCAKVSAPKRKSSNIEQSPNLLSAHRRCILPFLVNGMKLNLLPGATPLWRLCRNTRIT